MIAELLGGNHPKGGLNSMPSSSRLIVASRPLPCARGDRTSETPLPHVIYTPTVLTPILDANDRVAVGAEHQMAATTAHATTVATNVHKPTSPKSAIVSIRGLPGTFALALDYSLLHRALGCQRSGTKR